ncbi:MAG TPA: PDZ domain-containing protein [bacterium]|nr:PDZ domain-containing protein [bacterium]
MKSKYLKHGFLILMVFLLSSMGYIGAAYGEDKLTEIDKMTIMNLIADKVRSFHIDPINVIELYDGAIRGMIDNLDPHSSYMPPAAAIDFAERIEGNFEGIGITFSVINDKITVIGVIKNGPSERVGLKSRDKIVIIDGIDAVGISEDKVKELLRGPEGTEVQVNVERPGEEDLLKFSITRDRVEINSVSHAYMIDNITGYLALATFTSHTDANVLKALSMLKSQGMERLILDLRNNSGGLLNAAIRVADLFINEGKIVSTRGRRNIDNRVWEANKSARYGTIPIIVMINHISASASEIVAGALQDHDRALIVGQTSFGKGLVMRPIPLENNKDLGNLMLTVARYYTPSGRLIQRPYDGSKEDYLREGFDDFDPNALDADKKGRSVFKTDLGREVYGGGGITPDKTLLQNKILNELERTLRRSNLFFEFADGYLVRNNDIPDDFNEFLFNYRIPEHEIARFKEFAIGKDIKIGNVSLFREELKKLLKKFDVPEESAEAVEKSLVNMGIDLDETLFMKSIDYIDRGIKMEIARMLWGTEERYKIWHTEDTELISALSYFEEAGNLLERRLALGEIKQDE